MWIRPDATVKEAAALLADKHVSAAPVIDEAGQPVGVLSQSDIVAHCRELVEFLSIGPEYYTKADLQNSATALRTSLGVVDVDRSLVRDLMMPIIFSVSPETPVHKVVEDLLAHRIHRLFVVDPYGILVGIISSVDVLRHLHLDRLPAGSRETAHTSLRA
jgi:CBS domain-containing protein